MNIGILSTGIYLPNARMTAEEISEKANIPIEIIQTKMGIQEKPIPEEHDHTVQMGIWAAHKAI